MSESGDGKCAENTRIVREVYAAFTGGDIPAVLEAVTDDVDWCIYGPPEIPYAGPRHGRDAVAQTFASLDETVEFEHFTPDEYIAQGDQVVALGSEQLRVRATGQLAQNQWAMVFTFRDGKIARFRAFEDTAATIAAIRGS
jgi:ketosteroid isomerase-like protein